jgi:uncharacterized Zn finger protein (UPF0148 family)
MTTRICPKCGTTFVPNAANQKYDKWSCKTAAERQRRRARDKTEQEEPSSHNGLFATLRDPTLEDLKDLRKAYALTQSSQPTRLIGPLPEGWDEVIYLDTIVPEYGTDNHMYLPQL